MTKHLKHLALLLLLVIMSSIVLACNTNGAEQRKPLSTDGKDNDNNAIYFENQVVNSQIVDEFEGNNIIRSYSELEEFFADNSVSWDNQAIFNQFNADYFNDKALVFCYFWATDMRIKRRVENVYIEENTLQIEVMSIAPYPLTDMNEDCTFMFNILQVNKSDVLNITDIEVSFRYTELDLK
ncbi:MAG: hypothetical protein K2M47_07675 [Clostridiales bacterium]|nr:hypothetical protein [Clostridiales bacterium]